MTFEQWKTEHFPEGSTTLTDFQLKQAYDAVFRAGSRNTVGEPHDKGYLSW